MGRPLCGSFLTLILKHSSFTSHFFLHLRQLLTLLVHWVQNRGCYGWRSQQLEQTAGSTHIHSVIWATHSHILCTLSGYTPALGRKGLLLRSENEVYYLVARWMWLILLSGVGLYLRQSWSWAPLIWLWGHDATWDRPGTAHKAQMLRTDFPIYRGPGHQLMQVDVVPLTSMELCRFMSWEFSFKSCYILKNNTGMERGQ